MLSTLAPSTMQQHGSTDTLVNPTACGGGGTPTNALSMAIAAKLSPSEIERKDPAAALALLQQHISLSGHAVPPHPSFAAKAKKTKKATAMSEKEFLCAYGLGGGVMLGERTAKTFVPHSSKHVVDDNNDDVASIKTTSTSTTAASSTSTGANAKRVSAAEFSRMYGLGGMGIEGSAVNHFTGSSHRLYRDSSSKPKRTGSRGSDAGSDSSSSEATSSSAGSRRSTSSSASAKQRIAALFGKKTST